MYWCAYVLFLYSTIKEMYIIIHISCHTVYIFFCVCVCDYSQQIDYIIVPPTPSNNSNGSVFFGIPCQCIGAQNREQTQQYWCFVIVFLFHFAFSIRSFSFRWPNFIFIHIHSENSKKNITFNKMLTSISCLSLLFTSGKNYNNTSSLFITFFIIPFLQKKSIYFKDPFRAQQQTHTHKKKK